LILKKNIELNFIKYTILRIVCSNIFISAIIKFLIEEKLIKFSNSFDRTYENLISIAFNFFEFDVTL